MKKFKLAICLVIMCVMATANFALADTIRGINMNFVTIGHAGNPGDTRAQANPYGCGSVGYNYRIGKYEVTTAQWNAFVSSAGAPMDSVGTSYWAGLQQPAGNISWYGAVQFCNWLTSGDKSKGAYQFSGNNANPGTFLGINRTAAETTYGTIYVIPTENEWYKAAYYKPDGSGYALYSNGTNTAPTAGTQSNYYWVIGSPWNVGTGTVEQNGTYDMNGNVWEWNETLFNSGYYRGYRGGAFNERYPDRLSVSTFYSTTPGNGNLSLGFRVASIPEPATLLLLGLGGMVLRQTKR